MAYRDFTLEQVQKQFDLSIVQEDLFPGIQPLPLPAWLKEALGDGMQLSLVSEKSRSEYILAPVLLASRKLCHNVFAIYSGTRFDVDVEAGLVGECDFLLSITPPLPMVTAPVATLVEAKKNDLDLGYGQCIAQMIGALRFNLREGMELPQVFGCVTTGEVWQFLRLVGTRLTIDTKRHYINDIGSVLAVIRSIIATAVPTAIP